VKSHSSAYKKTAPELRETGIAKGDPDFNLECIGGKYANK